MQTGGKILAAGLVLGGAFPAVALLAIGCYEYLGCNTPRAGPCLVHGIDVTGLGSLGKSALELSIFTAPLGLLLCALGLIWLLAVMATRGRRQKMFQDGTSSPPVVASSVPQEPKVPATVSWTRSVFLARLVFDWFLGAAAMAIFASAAVLPTSHGRLLARGNAMFWQIAAALGIVITVAFIIRRRRYAPLLLLASALFFFTSCTANFHWQGG